MNEHINEYKYEHINKQWAEEASMQGYRQIL